MGKSEYSYPKQSHAERVRLPLTNSFGVAEELSEVFWWDGEWMGEPLSCFVTGLAAICDWDGFRMVYYIYHYFPEGIFVLTMQR